MAVSFVILSICFDGQHGLHTDVTKKLAVWTFSMPFFWFPVRFFLVCLNSTALAHPLISLAEMPVTLEFNPLRPLHSLVNTFG